MKTSGFYFTVLFILGSGWGLTQPLSKTAVSTGHQPFGLIVWQMVITSLALGLVLAVQRKGLPMARRHVWRYGLIALGGTIIPNGISYRAAAHLPSGYLSIIISLVPMFALPLALAIGTEKASILRALGVVCGAVAIVLLAGPQENLTAPSAVYWILFASLAPFMYAIEATWVAKVGIADLEPAQLLFGASVFGLLVVVPLAWFSGQWIDPTAPWRAPEYALIGSSLIHAFVYSAYVWLVGRTGSVFASQVSYLVTGTGVIWAMVLLGESYSLWVWAALGVMMVGLFLVQPKAPNVPLPDDIGGDTSAEV